MISSKKQTWLVIGGLGGIGRGIVLHALERGHKVVVCDVSKKDTCGTLQKYKDCGSYQFVGLDLRSAENISVAAKEIEERITEIDRLVIASRPKLDKNDDLENLGQWDTTFDVLLKGPIIFITRIKTLLRRSASSIIWIGSTNADYVSHQPLEYHAAKAAVNQATRVMARRYAKYGIRVNCISPALVDIGDKGQTVKNHPQKRTAMMATTPTGAPTNPYEIALLIDFISEKSLSSLTGQIINLDGGSTLLDHYDLATNLINRETLT